MGVWRVSFIVDYQWEIFITAEILSIVSLLLFGTFRYFFGRKKFSILFIIAFLLLLGLEALLGIWIYQETGEISTFQIILIIFVLYACTFGIYDFLKLDRWMRKKIGQWRGMELLTEKDYRMMELAKDPKYIARKYRYSAMIHLIIFVIIQSAFWIYGTGSMDELVSYLTDLSWIEAGTAEQSPYRNESLYSIGMLWGIIFIVDFLYSWSYTFFPGGKSR